MTGREGQTFTFNLATYLIVGTVYAEECGFEVWRAVNLFTNQETIFSEDFLKIEEKSSRLT